MLPIQALQQTFPDFKPASGSGFRPRPQTPIPLLPLTARVDEENIVKQSKPDLALDLGSSYRYENRKGANVYGCFGFAMPKKKRFHRLALKRPWQHSDFMHSFHYRSRKRFVGPLQKPKMMDTVFMADERGYRWEIIDS